MQLSRILWIIRARLVRERLIWVLRVIVLVVAILHITEDLSQESKAVFRQDADDIDETTYTSRRESTTGEAEEEDFVVGYVVG